MTRTLAPTAACSGAFRLKAGRGTGTTVGAELALAATALSPASLSNVDVAGAPTVPVATLTFALMVASGPVPIGGLTVDVHDNVSLATTVAEMVQLYPVWVLDAGVKVSPAGRTVLTKGSWFAVPLTIEGVTASR